MKCSMMLHLFHLGLHCLQKYSFTIIQRVKVFGTYLTVQLPSGARYLNFGLKFYLLLLLFSFFMLAAKALARIQKKKWTPHRSNMAYHISQTRVCKIIKGLKETI